MDEMMKYLEAFLKGIGYQFGSLKWTQEEEWTLCKQYDWQTSKTIVT
jgi:hypothetical protein